MNHDPAGWLPRGPAVAMDDGVSRLTFDELHARVSDATGALANTGLQRVATLADNSIDWVVADLAMLCSGIVHVPLPGFFTPTQVTGALSSAGVEALLLDPATPQLAARHGQGRAPSGLPSLRGLTRLRLERRAVDPVGPAAARHPTLPPGTTKITFTSGSTGSPKGVCLGTEGLLRVVESVCKATRSLHIRQHLCALPLAVLLENIAGVMVGLAHGATVHLRPVAALGWRGAAAFDAAMLDRQVRETGAESLILMPQMLRAWTAWLGAGRSGPSGLRFVAAGGAAVGAASILAARTAGLPVFEGYGLSEGGSVQTLNLPGADRPGSVGRALPHARIEVGEQAELQVEGALMLGYLGHAPLRGRRLATGDIGEVDEDGYVWVRGRRDHLIVTALGRNVSPEWVEGVLAQQPAIAHAIVLPDRHGALRAVIWPTAGSAHEAVDAAIAAAHTQLPDYARVSTWIRADRPLDAQSGLATPAGKPLRAAIAAAHPETPEETTA